MRTWRWVTKNDSTRHVLQNISNIIKLDNLVTIFFKPVFFYSDVGRIGRYNNCTKKYVWDNRLHELFGTC